MAVNYRWCTWDGLSNDGYRPKMWYSLIREGEEVLIVDQEEKAILDLLVSELARGVMVNLEIASHFSDHGDLMKALKGGSA